MRVAEYGLTRADARLLKSMRVKSWQAALADSGAELRQRLGKKDALDSGSASRRRKRINYPLKFTFGAGSVGEELGQIDMSAFGYEQPYLEGLRAVAEGRRTRQSPGVVPGKHDW